MMTDMMPLASTASPELSCAHPHCMTSAYAGEQGGEREREKEGERERQRQRETETERDRDRERKAERGHVFDIC